MSEGELKKRARKYGSGEWLDPSVVDVVASAYEEDLDEAKAEIFECLAVYPLKEPTLGVLDEVKLIIVLEKLFGKFGDEAAGRVT